MKKIIITGAYGQDGIILSEILKNKNFKVSGIVKKINKKKKLKNINYFKCNLTNYNDINKIFNKIKPDCIIHFGCKNPSYKELKKKKNFFHNNLKAIKNLANYIILNNKKIKLIFPGSSQMYGNKKVIVSENQKFSPNNSYAKFRVSGHKYLMKRKKKYDLFITTTILFNHDSVYRNKKFIIPRVIKAIKERNINFIKNITKENICADFSHAYDICFAIYLLIKSKHNTDKVILSANKLTYLNDIIRYIFKLTKFNFNLVKLSKKNKNIVGNNKLAKKLLNWKIKKNIFIASKEMLLKST